MDETKDILTTQQFDDADLMQSSSINWQYHAIYKLMPTAFSGENTIIMLPRLQLSYAKRSGGIFYTVSAPKGTVSVAVVTRSEGKICFGNAKLKEGDILFFDDKEYYSLFNNDTFEASIVSIPRKGFRKLTQMLTIYRNKVIQDSNNMLTAQMLHILESFKSNPSIRNDIQQQAEMEAEIIKCIETLLETQCPCFPKLTKGERIALEIRDRIYKRVTKKVTISSLSQEFNVSEQTLQNAFKSLFGITPNKFLRNLKLNHVRQALIEADPEKETILRIANRWGFTHMGHFSRYYTDLFGENPSLTLARKTQDH